MRLLWRNEKGQDLIEYSLFAGFIAVLAAAAIPVAINASGAAMSRIVSLLTGVAGSLSPS